MDEINLLDYLGILSRRKRTIGVTVLAMLVLAVGALIVLPKTYESETTLLIPKGAEFGINSQLAELVGFSLPGPLPSLSGEGVYINVLKSRTLAESVCKRLRLDRYEIEYKDLQKQIAVDKPKDGGLIFTCQVPTSWLKGHVEASKLRESAARLSADIANTYIDELRTYDHTNSLFVGKKNRLYIEEQLERSKTDLHDAEERLRVFQEAHPTLIPPDKSVAYSEQALGLASARTETDIALRQAIGQIEQARATWAIGAPSGISPEAVIDSPTIGGLRADIANLEVKRATLLENFTEAHPDVVSLDQQIAKAREKLDSEVTRVIAGSAASVSPAHQELLKQLVIMEIQRDGLQSKQAAIAKALANLETHLSGLPADEMRYARLLRDRRTTETVYTTLLAELAKARIAEGRDTDNFIVLDEAVVPDKPAKPSAPLLLAVSIVLGLMGGGFLAVVQEGIEQAGYRGRRHKAQRARGRRTEQEDG